LSKSRSEIRCATSDSDQEILRLCASIEQEKDPRKFSLLLEQMADLLRKEQEAIKAKIRANTGGNLMG